MVRVFVDKRVRAPTSEVNFMTGKKRIETNEIEGVVTKSFSDFDDHRVEGLTNLSSFQESKAIADQRNLARLQKKYGDAHPLVRETEAKIESNKLFAAEIKEEIVRTRTTIPNSNADAWTIHGYVFDEENNPSANVRVMIFDENGEPVSRTETAATDKKGYFRLLSKNVKNLPERVRVGVSSEFLSEEIYTPELGELDYAEIFVSGEIDETPPCEPTETPRGEPIPTGQNFSDWLVIGKISDADGKGVPKLKVRVFDRDLMLDDALGETETNAEGVYRLKFTKEQFSDFGEEYPELYLIVEDANGNKLFDGKREMRTRAGRIELVEVQLKDTKSKDDKKQ
jgi:5-hydroxyisourate hydrolase-like protein (transthyretin family)